MKKKDFEFIQMVKLLFRYGTTKFVTVEKDHGGLPSTNYVFTNGAELKVLFKKKLCTKIMLDKLYSLSIDIFQRQNKKKIKKIHLTKRKEQFV